MNNFVITIARGFGSGGKQVGMALSERLGIPCYESQILTMASNYSGINKDLFAQVDEKLRGHHLLKRLKHTTSQDKMIKPTEKKFISDDNLYNIQAKIIQELGNIQSCIIIGKCANYVLRDYKNVISIYIEAPRKACVESVMGLLGVTEHEAHKIIEETDKYRSDYYKYYTHGEDWTNPVSYDMTLNSFRVGRMQCVDVIMDYLKVKFGEEIFDSVK